MASPTSMEPVLPEVQRKDLEDLATDFAKSNALSGGLGTA